MDQQKIGRFIKETRKEKGITQQEIANQLNITDRAISKWENGRCMPDIAFLEPLSIILNVEVTELIRGEKIPKEDLTKINSVVEDVVNVSNLNNQEKRKKLNNWITGGLFCFSLYLIDNHIQFLNFFDNSSIYEFIRGLLMGMTLYCYLMGYLTNNKYISKIKSFKKSLIKKQ